MRALPPIRPQRLGQHGEREACSRMAEAGSVLRDSVSRAGLMEYRLPCTAAGLDALRWSAPQCAPRAAGNMQTCAAPGCFYLSAEACLLPPLVPWPSQSWLPLLASCWWAHCSGSAAAAGQAPPGQRAPAQHNDVGATGGKRCTFLPRFIQTAGLQCSCHAIGRTTLGACWGMRPAATAARCIAAQFAATHLKHPALSI